MTQTYLLHSLHSLMLVPVQMAELQLAVVIKEKKDLQDQLTALQDPQPPTPPPEISEELSAAELLGKIRAQEQTIGELKLHLGAFLGAN